MGIVVGAGTAAGGASMLPANGDRVGDAAMRAERGGIALVSVGSMRVLGGAAALLFFRPTEQEGALKVYE